MTKAAKDGTEFEPYPTYSMSILWSFDALTPDAFAFAGVSATPLDGDAMARTRFQELRLADAWTKLEAGRIRRLRNNHHEIDRSNR